MYFFSFFSGPGFWLLMVAVFVAVELATTALVSIWFVVGSVAALLVGLITRLWWPQWLAFALVSVISQQLAKPLVARLRAKRAPAMNVERNVGRVATVLTPIGPGRQGRARLDGVDWNALCSSPLAVGESCLVLQVEGTALVVAPMPKTPPPPGFFAQTAQPESPAQPGADAAAGQPAAPNAPAVQTAPDMPAAQNAPAAQSAPLPAEPEEDARPGEAEPARTPN